MSQKNMVWIIAGPTAGGKSQLALDLAKSAEGVVINADSMQIYREIPILSAQPSSYDRQKIPHEMYGFHPIAKNFSAASWAQRARDAVMAAFSRDLQPILVGGSGLYLKALIEGFSDIPEVPPILRKHISDLYDMLGPHGFHEMLRKIDPETAERLHPTDRQRCIRAREVFEASGETLSAWQSRPKRNIAPEFHYKTVLVLPPRDWLYQRVDERFSQMVDEGAIEEARSLSAANLPHDVTGARALGLQSLRDYLDGRMTLNEATEQGQTQSRQYAKRQYTWFRNQKLPHSALLSDPHDDWLALAQKHLHTA